MMDVRLSAEQVALRDSVASAVSRLGPHGVADLDDAERAAKLDAAVDAAGWRDIRMAEEDGSPLASGVEVALVAAELAAGAADVAFCGPVLAAELRRLARVPGATSRETVALGAGMESIAVQGDPRWPDSVCPDADGATTALALGPGRHTIASVELSTEDDYMDLTRTIARVTTSPEATDLGGELTADAVARSGSHGPGHHQR